MRARDGRAGRRCAAADDAAAVEPTRCAHTSPSPAKPHAATARARPGDEHRGVLADRREPVPHGRSAAAVDVLERRRHRVVRERAPVPARRPAAAEGRGAHRGADQLLPLRLPGARRAASRSRSRPRSAPSPWNPTYQARADRPADAPTIDDAKVPPRNLVVPDRRVGLDGRAEQAAAAQARDGAARRAAAPAGSRRDRRLRRQRRARAAADAAAARRP